ncbi:MAG: restriction endonuclease subunit S [Ignavibacteria bacterium]|nr:restriction endonuclease subunit S [Ignavibacteria bacterium]
MHNSFGDVMAKKYNNQKHVLQNEGISRKEGSASGKRIKPESPNSERWNIPSGWEVMEVADVCVNFLNGGTPSTSINEYWNGEIPWITGADILDQKVAVVRKFITKKAVEESSTNLIPKGSVLLVTRTGVGKVSIAPFDIAISQDLTGLITQEDLIVNEYAFYFFLGNVSKLKKLNQGTSINGITREVLQRLKIPLPPLREQKAIAHMLRTWDEAISKTNELIAQKELRKKWLMQKLLTGKLRLKGFGGEWKKLGAGEIFKSITKKGFADEELLSATQDRGMIPRTMLEGRVTMPTTGTEGYKLVEIGDFVISLRSFQGGLEYSYYRGLVSPAYTVLKPKKPINEEFYKQYFKSYEFIGRLATAVIGIRDGKQISYDDFCIVKIPYPSYNEQSAIAQVLQAADKEISLLKAKAEKLREQKKGLMQVLLTGRRRLIVED